MAIVMILRWPGFTTAQYDAARKVIDMDGNEPAGLLTHVAWPEADGYHVVDTWNTAEEFNRYVEQRLMPAMKRLNIPGEPEVQIHPVHATLNPRSK